MKLTILPNWCKWLSLFLFVAYFAVSFPAFKQGFIEEWSKPDGLHPGTAHENVLIQYSEEHKASNTIDLFSGLLFFSSILVYLLSKDKHDDEYIDAIRAKAFSLALMLITVVILLVSIFGKDLECIDVLIIQFLSYIIIFKALKIRAEIFATDEPTTL
ncbi:MAG: hypothetical protein FWG54_06125 [Bacteroidetes bacterium]|nr:hypothetical protein [Bacteroidota bacterium]